MMVIKVWVVYFNPLNYPLKFNPFPPHFWHTKNSSFSFRTEMLYKQSLLVWCITVSSSSRSSMPQRRRVKASMRKGDSSTCCSHSYTADPICTFSFPNNAHADPRLYPLFRQKLLFTLRADLPKQGRVKVKPYIRMKVEKETNCWD